MYLETSMATLVFQTAIYVRLNVKFFIFYSVYLRKIMRILYFSIKLKNESQKIGNFFHHSHLHEPSHKICSDFSV